MMNISSSTAQCPFLEKNCPKLIFHEKSNRYIYYFNNKDFLILLKSCVTTLDKKKTKRDIVTVCNSCIILSVLSKQKLETMCQDKAKIVAKNMNCNKMMIKLVSENVLAVLQRCIMINFVVKKSSTRVQYTC